MPFQFILLWFHISFAYRFIETTLDKDPPQILLDWATTPDEKVQQLLKRDCAAIAIFCRQPCRWKFGFSLFRLNFTPKTSLNIPSLHKVLSLRACLYGVSIPRQPYPRDNFTKRLYENCMTETQLTLLNYAYILRRNKHHLPLSLCSSPFIKYSCVFTFTKWTNTS